MYEPSACSRSTSRSSEPAGSWRNSREARETAIASRDCTPKRCIMKVIRALSRPVNPVHAFKEPQLGLAFFFEDRPRLVLLGDVHPRPDVLEVARWISDGLCQN